MKVNTNWLKDYVTPGIPPEKLLERLTMAGLEVEKHYVNKGDTVFEMEITPNRADCLSVLGIAREIATILNKPLKEPKIKPLIKQKTKCSLKIEDFKDCSKYVGVVVENITVKKSDNNVQAKLNAIDLRPINNIVDITNFCLMEMGQPLHAFDYDKLEGGQIIVRRAKKGESIITIDDQKVDLDPSILIIADAKKPVAIAGIMGGKDSQVTDKTKNILLESASFDSVLIRRTGRKIAISSDSSYRFERGVDSTLVEKCSARAIDLILASAKGKVTKTGIVQDKKANKTIKISLQPTYINDRLGANISVVKIKQILKGLGITVSGTQDKLVLAIPSSRPDLKQPVDIVEEVARIIGYDELPLSLPPINMQNVERNAKMLFLKKVKSAILSSGCSEAITFSMINSNLLKKTNLEILEGISIKNPLSLDQEIMRPSMMPSMLNVVLTNLNRGTKNIKNFELGKVYQNKKEHIVVSFILTGNVNSGWRSQDNAEGDFYDLKGIIERVLNSAKIDKNKIKYSCSKNEALDLNEQTEVLVGGKKVGELGKVSASVLKQWHIKAKKVYYGEINLDKIFSNKIQVRKYVPPIEYPSITRDVSLAVKKEVTFSQVKDIARKFGTKILTDINFVEEYLGEKIEEGYRGIVFSLKYQSAQKTLKESDVTDVHTKICQELINQLGAIQR